MEINTGNQLKGYIRREIKGTPMHSNYGYNYYFCRSFLERLYGENPDTFILKGSLSQFSTLKQFTRPITDIDITTFDKVENAKEVIEDVISSSGNIKYTIKQKFVTTNATINYRIMCQFDQIAQMIEVDLRKEVNDAEVLKTDLPILFSKDNPFEVNTFSLEEHLARKIYISFLNLVLYEQLGKEFRRFKDFYDIYSILGKGDINHEAVAKRVREYISKDQFLANYTLKSNLFSDQFIKQNNEQYDLISKKNEFDSGIKLSDTTAVLNEYISRIK